MASVVSHTGNLRKTSLQLKSPLGFSGSHFQEYWLPMAAQEVARLKGLHSTVVVTLQG